MTELRAATRQLLLATAGDLTVPVDATSLFTNADMLGNATTADWTDVPTTLGDGDIEVLHQTFKLQQTQTDLPNGVYEAVFHAFYRNDGSGRQPVATAAAGNTVNGNLNALQDIKKNEVLLNTEETMAGAAQTLTSDQAQTTLSDIIVADHQMTLSANVTNSSQWLNFQGFSLTYKNPFVTVQVPASGYTTFYYSNQSFLLPEGMQACTLKENNGTIVVSREFNEAGSVLPAGHPHDAEEGGRRVQSVARFRRESADVRRQLLLRAVRGRAGNRMEMERGKRCHFCQSRAPCLLRLSKPDDASGLLSYRTTDVRA